MESQVEARGQHTPPARALGLPTQPSAIILYRPFSIHQSQNSGTSSPVRPPSANSTPMAAALTRAAPRHAASTRCNPSRQRAFSDAGHLRFYGRALEAAPRRPRLAPGVATHAAAQPPTSAPDSSRRARVLQQIADVEATLHALDQVCCGWRRKLWWWAHLTARRPFTAVRPAKLPAIPPNAPFGRPTPDIQPTSRSRSPPLHATHLRRPRSHTPAGRAACPPAAPVCAPQPRQQQQLLGEQQQ